MIIIKGIIAPFVIFSFCFLAFNTGIYAATVTAKSCSYSDVSSAISSASAGDTVTVPSGSCTWTSGITISKSLNLIGAGAGNTVITNGGTTLIRYNPSNWNMKNSARISGFTFNLNNAGTGIVLGVSAKTAPFTLQEIRIDHNTFSNKNTDVTNYIIDAVSPMIGVIDNNLFDKVVYPISWDFQGGTQYYATYPQSSWVLGSDDRVYVEDNIFNMVNWPSDNITTLSHCQYSGRQSYRYNTFNTSAAVSGGGQDFIDQHGSQGCSSSSGSMCSCFGSEVYGNRINAASSYSPKWATARGGKSVWFYNDYVGSGTPSFNVSISAVSCPSSGYIEENMVHDTYSWRNRKNTTGTLTSVNCDECPPYLSNCGRSGNRPLENTDYFDDDYVGCGTLANLPATCTTGQGYWVTNQSCTSLANLTGDINTYPSRQTITGTLYKCVSTNTWQAWYTPYAYPHPLRSEGPPDTQAPTVPTNLGANAVSSSQINLSWTASTDDVWVAGYRIYRCQGSGCTPTTQIATSGTNSYSNTGLSATTTYVYRVAAYDAAGNVSAQSSSASATTPVQPAVDTTPPSTPANLTASAVSTSRINLSWTASTDNVGVTGYRIYRCQGTTCTATTQIATSSTTSYQDTGLAASTTYRYRVRAYDAAGNVSSYSSAASATTQTPDTSPAPPAGLKIQ
jgi:chitodextrinase